jgi:hypothetical protein
MALAENVVDGMLVYPALTEMKSPLTACSDRAYEPDVNPNKTASQSFNSFLVVRRLVC